MSSFTKPLDLRFLDLELDEKPFQLLTAFEYHIGEEGSGNVVLVPAGYRTDFASIPRFLHRVFSPIGRHGKAAVIHDWIVDNERHRFTSTEAAEIFREAMTVLGVTAWRRQAMVNAVKAFGPKYNDQ